MSKNKKSILFLLFLIVVIVSGFLYFFTERKKNLDIKIRKENSLKILERDQGFPIKPVNETYSKTFVVGDFILKEISLGSDYFSIAAISGLYQDGGGQQQKLIIPIAVLNKKTNVLQINEYAPQDFHPEIKTADEDFWVNHTKIHEGQIILVTIMMPSEELKNNSTQGFGFEVPRYTQEDLESFYKTGDPNIFKDNVLWPIIDLYVDTSLNYVDPSEPVQNLSL